MLTEGRTLPVVVSSAADQLKNPYVLEFLGLPDTASFHESDLERAIITHLQRFLLELGNGFAFVARQKHLRLGEQDRYIDLVGRPVAELPVVSGLAAFNHFSGSHCRGHKRTQKADIRRASGRRFIFYITSIVFLYFVM